MMLTNGMSSCMRWSMSTLIKSARIAIMGSVTQMPTLTLVPYVSTRAIASNTSSQDDAPSKIHAHGLMKILSTRMGKAKPKGKVSPQERKAETSPRKTLPKKTPRQ